MTNTVQEARGWSLDSAWITFNYGLILMIGGILVILYNNLPEERPYEIFALVWSVVMLYSTWQHVRYEYYLAINVALFRQSVSVLHLSGDGKISCVLQLESLRVQHLDKADKGCDEDITGKKTEKNQKKSTGCHLSRIIPDARLSSLPLVLRSCLCILLSSYSYANASGNAIR